MKADVVAQVNTPRRPYDRWNRRFESCRKNGGTSIVFVACFVGSGLCDELFTRPADSDPLFV
jgi:hypothetical protein